MIIDDYFASIERSLRQNARISHIQEPITCLASDDYNGILRCRVFLWDGSFLDLHETVSTELGYPVRINYAYTFIHQGQRVFRYDNAPHHPEIATHPHHKHIGPADRLAPADQPSLNQVLSEVESWLEERPGTRQILDQPAHASGHRISQSPDVSGKTPHSRPRADEGTDGKGHETS